MLVQLGCKIGLFYKLEIDELACIKIYAPVQIENTPKLNKQFLFTRSAFCSNYYKSFLQQHTIVN